MPIDLGHELLHIRVLLQANTDFLMQIRNPAGGAWPSTVTAELVFDGTTPTTWSAALFGDVLVFQQTEAQVNTLLAKNPEHAVLYYIDGSTRLGWAHGGVSIR